MADDGPAPHLTVRLGLLRESLEVLLVALERASGPVIDLDADYYWSLIPSEVLDVERGPSEPGIGMVSDCLQDLDELTRDPECAVPHHLVWLGDVLRAIGATVRADLLHPTTEDGGEETPIRGRI